jgi:2-C-methyl-D-erythritol 4-phosphate cytidylyltransferase
MNIALIIAGGIGSRMNNKIPKQFLTVNDKPIIIYTLEKFQKSKAIDKILVVTLENWFDYLNSYLLEYKIDKVKWIIKGGNSNQESINKGVDFLTNHCNDYDNIIIHAANRPLIDEHLIDKCIKSCNKYGSGITSLPNIEVACYSDNGNSTNIEIDRDKLFRIQTPQAFKYFKLKEIYNYAKKENICDCGTAASLMIRKGEKVYLVEGINLNMKITTPDDLKLFKLIIMNERSD